MASITPDHWLQAWAAYNGLAGQQQGLRTLHAGIQAADPALLDDQAHWLVQFRQNPAATSPAHTPNTWEGVAAAALAAGCKWPDLVAAQWALESARGTRVSGQHNYFGLKGQGTEHTTQEQVGDAMVTIDAQFLDFPSLNACVSYLVSRWYLDWHGYTGVNSADTIGAAAHQLVEQGYATDRQYAVKLLALVQEHGTMPQAPATPAAAKPPASSAGANPLPVPYLQQLDNTSDGWRKCFTTTSAMIAEYLGAEPRGVAGETAYDHVRSQYGDTTTSEAQLAALRSLGLQAHYGTDGTQQRIIDLIDQGHPVGLGMLHHGSTAHPTGGHWILAIGYTTTHCIVHDPYGEQDLVAGTWAKQGGRSGMGLKYSWKNLLPRWQPGGSGGWYLWASK